MTASNKKRWSQQVTNASDALDLQKDVFTWKEPEKIAASLKDSAEQSQRRKGTAYQSAMSMLNFYINRAGKKLSQQQKQILNQAKDKLRQLYDK